MGFVLSKFRKKKPSIKDSLERIEKELRGIQRFQVDTEIQQKRIIGRLTIVAFVIFTIASVVYYFFGPRNQTWQERLLWIVPYIVFPVLIWSLRKLLGWWYQQKIVRNKEKSESLRKEKEQLLEDVMDKETFKVAKEILEKYAPRHLLPKYLEEQQRSSPVPQARPITPLTSRVQSRMSTGGMSEFSDGLRRRGAQSTPGVGYPLGPRSMTPGGPMMMQRFGPPGGMQQGPAGHFRPQMRPAIMPPPGTQGAGMTTPQFRGQGPSMFSMPTGLTPMRYMMPLPPSNPVMQNRKTGWMDKLVDYVVGDGPTCRYALICRYCATHNGLATPEDFPFTSYRCVYCRQFNPSKEQRPSAQTLPKNTVLIEEMESTIKSDNEEETSVNGEDSEKEGSAPEGGQGDQDTTLGVDGTEEGQRSNSETQNENEEGSPEPLVELPGSTSDLSSRKSGTEESDQEERERMNENIRFADEDNEEDDAGSDEKFVLINDDAGTEVRANESVKPAKEEESVESRSEIVT